MIVSAGEALEGVELPPDELRTLLDAGLECASMKAWPVLAIGECVTDIVPGGSGFNAIRCNPALPVPAILRKTASDLTAYGPMHWSERRKFGVAELRRLCSFPDQFDFPGTRAAASAQMGNSVMPLFMAKVAEFVRRSIA